MASIYRPTYTAPDGTRRRQEAYVICYRDATGRRRKVPGFRDKRATEAKARQLETAVERCAAGIADDAALDRARPLYPAIDAYREELLRTGRTPAYAKNAAGFLRRTADALRWRVLGDLRPDGLATYLAAIARQGRSQTTQNAYRDAWVSFGAWLLRQGWVAENVLTRVQKARVTRRPRQRRAFGVAELAALIAAAPAYRGDVYRVAALSGLRRGELRQLTDADFTLGDFPQWHLRACIAKSKRVDRVPMLPACAEILQRTALPLRVGTRRAFVRDMERAALARRTDAGQLDYHSLRYFFASWLGRLLPIQTVRLLMRHRDIRTTCNLYMQLGIDDLAADVLTLPRLELAI